MRLVGKILEEGQVITEADSVLSCLSQYLRNGKGEVNIVVWMNGVRLGNFA